MGELAILVPLAPFIMVCFIVWTKHQSKLAEVRLKAAASESVEKATQYARQIKGLEDRIAVLERIVTDTGYNVSTQIEALRDTKRVEDESSGVPLDLPRKERV